jgi:glutamate-ammonia-ligase adenylyltransferase
VVTLRLAYERARSETRTAGADVVVLALGKLGARELLFGSDLDLVYFGRGGGDLSASTAVARRLATILAAPTPHGRLYEVDPRLRPGGESGPLVATPGALRDYFARGLGQTWERLAYTRARAVAGPPTLCEEVVGAVEETVYEGGFTPADAAAIREMREKLAKAGGPQSIKRGGSGGVVDIEFVAQMHALSRGRDDRRFRVGNVPRLLTLLKEERILEPQRAADLHVAYAFLLALENRIRLVADLPEDRLPEEPKALRSLARRLGYVDTTEMRAEESLRDEYAYHKEVAARAFRDALKTFG